MCNPRPEGTRRPTRGLLAALLLAAFAAAPAAAADDDNETASGQGDTRLVDRAAAAGEVATAVAQPPRGPRRMPVGAGQVRARRDPKYGLSFYSGYRAIHMESPLFEDNEYDLGITDGDFVAARYGAEFEWAVASRLAVILGVQNASRDLVSSYIDLVYDDGGEIERFTSLNLTDVSVGARFRLRRPDARFSPYIALGLGLLYYRYSEIGDFVDFSNYDIYYDEYTERQGLFSAFVGGGLDFTLAETREGTQVGAFGEFRYAGSSSTHQDGFEGFGDFSLGRTGVLAGLRVRF